MRLRTDVMVAAAFVMAVSAAASPVCAQSAVEAAGSHPDAAEISRALEAVKADPNLATDRTIKMLRWRDSTKPKPSGTPWWLAWIAGLFRWMEQSARVLVWGAAAFLAGVLVVYLLRIVRAHGVSQGEALFVAPTHVRDLDIRPESLPHDLGGAARRLWDRGEHRASLALLYRGLLSRLAHIHRVPIRDSSTEGDCLSLAARHLTQARCEYASRLVTAWQRFVYAGQDIPAETVYVLCDDFARALNASPRPPQSMPSGGAA